MESKCPLCFLPVGLNDQFCSKCGARLSTAQRPLTFWKKVTIYFVTIVLAPLGLYWFFKFYKSSESDNRRVAWIVLWLTLVVMLATIVFSFYIVNSLSGYVGSVIGDPTLYDF